MRIAIFHLGFFYAGGGERLVLEEAIGLQKRGYEVEIFSPVINKNCFPELQRQVKLKPILPQLPRFIYDRETLLVLISCLIFPLLIPRFRKFDIFIGANQPGPWFCWWLNKLLKKPYVIYIAQPTRILYPRAIDKEVGLRANRSYSPFIQVFKLFRPFVYWADRVSIRQADKMLVNGSYIYNVIRKVYSREGIVCPAGSYAKKVSKGTVKNRFKGSIKVKDITIKKPYILLTNRHFPQKKFEYALEMMKRIRNPKAKLVITGEENRYTRFLHKLIKKLKLDKQQIIFTGLVSEKDLELLYIHAACYVYTAPEEDFGMGVIEAMGYAVPVVAWKSGGPQTTVIDDKTGYLMPVGDIDKFSSAVNRLLENKSLNEKMGLAAAKRAQQKFSYEKHNSILEETLLKVVSRQYVQF